MYFKDKKENELQLFSKLMLIIGCEVKKKKIYMKVRKSFFKNELLKSYT